MGGGRQTDMNKRLHIKISGQVQMVGFRFATIKLAEELGLTGWVRNTEDGGVEILAEGGEENLNKLLKWAQNGPPAAEVEEAKEEWLEYKNEFEGFEAVV